MYNKILYYKDPSVGLYNLTNYYEDVKRRQKLRRDIFLNIERNFDNELEYLNINFKLIKHQKEVKKLFYSMFNYWLHLINLISFEISDLYLNIILTIDLSIDYFLNIVVISSKDVELNIYIKEFINSNYNKNNPILIEDKDVSKIKVADFLEEEKS
jgi:hypothetical protein